MAITVHGSSTQAAGTSTTFDFTLPAGVQDGDVAVAFLHWEGTKTITPPAGQGYTATDAAAGNGTAIFAQQFTAALQAADASSTAHDFTMGGGGVWREGWLVVLRGADSTTVLRVADPANATTGTDASAETPAEAATLTAGDWALWQVATLNVRAKTYPATADGNTVTERYDGAPSGSLSVGSAEYGASAVSSVAVTWTTNDTWVAKTLTVRVAGGGGAPAASLVHAPYSPRVRPR